MAGASIYIKKNAGARRTRPAENSPWHQLDAQESAPCPVRLRLRPRLPVPVAALSAEPSPLEHPGGYNGWPAGRTPGIYSCGAFPSQIAIQQIPRFSLIFFLSLETEEEWPAPVSHTHPVKKALHNIFLWLHTKYWNGHSSRSL
jgi:hypothetical protein